LPPRGMIVALLLLMLAAWITWVLFRDRDPGGKSDPARAQEPDERDQRQRAEE